MHNPFQPRVARVPARAAAIRCRESGKVDGASLPHRTGTNPHRQQGYLLWHGTCSTGFAGETNQ